jgi:opacity protein-like surface antigen
MSSHLLISMFVLLAAAHTAAQSPRHRGEVFGGIGAARMGGDEGSLGKGPHALGGVGVRFAPRLSLEVDVTRTQHERDIAGGPLKGTATGVFGSGVYHFSERRTQVFVMGGVGLLRSEIVHTYSLGGTTTTVRSDDNDFAWGGGGGVKIFVTPRFSVRPQFRLVFSEATGVMGLAAGSVAIGYHW